MKNIFLSFLSMLFTTALFAQQNDSIYAKSQKLNTSIYIALGIGENRGKQYNLSFAVYPDFTTGGTYTRVEQLNLKKGREFCFGVMQRIFAYRKLGLDIGFEYANYLQKGEITKQSVTSWHEKFTPPNVITQVYTTNYDYGTYGITCKESYVRIPLQLSLKIFKHKTVSMEMNSGVITAWKRFSIDAGFYSIKQDYLSFIAYFGNRVFYKISKNNQLFIEPNIKHEFTGDVKKIIAGFKLGYTF